MIDAHLTEAAATPAHAMGSPLLHVLYVTADPVRPDWLASPGERFVYLRALPGDALEQLRDPRVALVCLDSSVGFGTAAPLMGFMRDREPDVPILWIAAPSSEADVLPALGAFGDQAPDRILARAPEPERLLEHLEGLLGTRVYSEAVVEVLSTAVDRAMQTEGGTSQRKLACFLKSSRQPLACYGSSVDFCGPSLSGCLTVEAERQPLRALLRQAAPSICAATNELLQDLLGELGNNVLGFLKQFYARSGVLLASGPPRAHGKRKLHSLAARAGSSLVLEMSAEGTLFFQLRMTCDSTVDVDTARRSLADSGEVKFL